VGLLLLLFLGAIGQVVRDPSPGWALLFYLPLLPIGAAAILLDLVCRGRCLSRPRFGLALLGGVAVAGAVASLTGLGRDTETRAEAPVGLLHWNVHWGGGNRRSDATWAALRSDIQARAPDVIVLSEAPDEQTHWVPQLLRPGWEAVQCEHEAGSPEWYRLVVCAPGPVRKEWDRAVTHGHVMAVVVRLRERPLRILVVDGRSDPRLSRVALLADVAGLCREGQQKGEPIDILAGDFNTPARSRGFDLLEESYRVASRSAVGWRATFPAFCPLYDIDHVWLHRRLAVHSCELFTSTASDHRGQFVRFYLPAP